MENYREPRQSGFSVWGWVFVAIVIGFLVWLFVVPATNYRARPLATAPAASPIGDVAAIHDTPTSYVGREVEFRNVEVSKPVSDAAFWVGRGDNEVLVVRESANAANNANETANQTSSQQPAAEQGMKNQGGPARTTHNAEEPKKGNQQEKSAATETNTASLNKGDKVDINGTVQPFPGVDEAQKQWGVSADTAKELRDKAAVVVVASEVAPGGSLGAATLPQSDENNANPGAEQNNPQNHENKQPENQNNEQQNPR